MKKVIIILLILALIFYLAELDLPSMELFLKLRTPVLSSLALALAFLGSKSFLVPFNLAFAYIFRKTGFGLLIPLGTLSSWIINHLIKELIKRPRPAIISLAFEGSYSFPSGHSMVTASFIFLMSLFIKTHYDRDLSIYAYGYLFIMMLSRVYIGVHYPTDVLVGGALGLIYYQGLTRYFGDKYDSKNN